MEIETRGGCLCGDLRYRYAGSPLAYYACHCSDCQRQTGSAFGLSMIVKADEVNILKGSPALFEIEMSDGRTKRGRYCGRCAARVWGEPVKLPTLFVLRPGTFDEALLFPPFGDIWTSEAQAWVAFNDGPRFPVQPEDSLALVRAWKAQHPDE